MKIWIFNHYAGTPETTFATRHYDLARELVLRHHKLTIFASSFSEYSFREMKLSHGQRWTAEENNGVVFIWLKTLPYFGNGARRILNMVSYSWNAVITGFGIKERPDVVIGTSVHPLAALAGWLVAAIKRARFFFEVTDLWPQTLIDMGALKHSSPVAFGLRTLEKFLCRRAEKVITLMPHAVNYFATCGVPENKVVWIPHCIDTSRYCNTSNSRNSIFTVMYAGRYGKVNALDDLVEAARLLCKKAKGRIRFVLVGDGPEKSNLIRKVEKLGLDNIEFRNAVPKNQLYRVLAEADAFILTMKDMPLYKFGISPNKLCDYFIMGKPVLLAGRPRNNPVDEAEAGFTVPPGNPSELAKAVLKLSDLPRELRLRMGENGINYVRLNHDTGVLTDRLENILYRDAHRTENTTCYRIFQGVGPC